ncbi:hypothetical protein MSAN_02334000 [Mycena sanguinolenta]|uniref:Uncharacterized protein n=1 Tax=Mycena sanguinolenta TaxID=230812 RepID=A0A8H6X757_9AGAR|nr:hypothetical protein MSAN_02334000 [Mycena sanguinolenta]
MCWMDTFQKGFSCGATTGQMVLAGLGVQPTPAVSTRATFKCSYKKNREAEYIEFRRRNAQHPNPPSFDLWLANIRQLPSCGAVRIYAGVQKTCSLTDTLMLAVSTLFHCTIWIILSTAEGESS